MHWQPGTPAAQVFFAPVAHQCVGWNAVAMHTAQDTNRGGVEKHRLVQAGVREMEKACDQEFRPNIQQNLV